MKIPLFSSLLTSATVVIFANTIETATASTFPKFTCNVLQFPGNGCSELDILTMELLMSGLFVAELSSVSTIYFSDFFDNSQDVFSVNSITGLVSYQCSSSLLSVFSLCLPGGGRRLASNICTQPDYCKQNKQVCILAGCPTSSYRRLGAPDQLVDEDLNRLLGTFNITKLTLDGTKLIQNMIAPNPLCKPKDLGFRCDLV